MVKGKGKGTDGMAKDDAKGKPKTANDEGKGGGDICYVCVCAFHRLENSPLQH